MSNFTHLNIHAGNTVQTMAVIWEVVLPVISYAHLFRIRRLNGRVHDHILHRNFLARTQSLP